MASHTIEETNSEYSASFLSNGGGDHGGRHRGNSNPHQRGGAYAYQGGERDALGRNNSTVLEVDEFSESSKHS